jgi:hypothetical protein
MVLLEQEWLTLALPLRDWAVVVDFDGSVYRKSSCQISLLISKHRGGNLSQNSDLSGMGGKISTG